MVHPDEVVARRTIIDEDGVVHQYDEVLAGEAMDGGPVMLNWRDVDSAGVDAPSGLQRGDPRVRPQDRHARRRAGRLPAPRRRRARAQAWLAVMQAEYEAFREKVIIAERFGGETPWLDAYGAQSIDEFFAVACEAYFVNRERFETEFPALMPLLDGFFRQLSCRA